LIGHFKDRSSYYLNLFPQWGFEELYINPKEHPEFAVNATEIREKLFAGDKSWLNRVPASIADYLSAFRKTGVFEGLTREFGYLQKYKEDTRFKGVPFDPVFITTDVVVVQSGHLLVIRRGHQPGRGLLALPGGFLQPDLTLEENAVKELKEETRINVPVSVLKGSVKDRKEFDYPDRSQRGRTITFAYFIELQASLKDGLPKVKGGDDAAKAFWLPLSALGEKEEEFFEDHIHIVRYFLGM
jgi:bifunctional NMN adenylyltransferase/nudix hydrolase